MPSLSNGTALSSLTATLFALVVSVQAAAQGNGADFMQHARRAAPRDAFPVFHNPKLVPPERARNLRDDEWVIGVAINGEAKAYPIAVMGNHELGNDTCGGTAIAVSW